MGGERTGVKKFGYDMMRRDQICREME